MKAEVGVWEAVPNALDYARELGNKRNRAGISYLNASNFAATSTLRDERGPLDLSDSASSFVQKGSPGFSELNLPLTPLQKHNTHRAFQRLYLTCEGRLGEPEPLRCPAKMQFFAHRDEIPNSTNVKHYGRTSERTIRISLLYP